MLGGVVEASDDQQYPEFPIFMESASVALCMV